jgi:hypothetical protein
VLIKQDTSNCRVDKKGATGPQALVLQFALPGLHPLTGRGVQNCDQLVINAMASKIYIG